jgi:hypothetical protein
MPIFFMPISHWYAEMSEAVIGLIEQISPCIIANPLLMP